MLNVEKNKSIDYIDYSNDVNEVMEWVRDELERLESKVEEEKNQKELERIYKLKHEAKWFVAGRKEPMSYRDITMYLENKKDSDEKRYPEFYEALLHAKNELENNYPGIERNVIMYIDVLGQKKYKEEKVEEEKNPEEKKNVEEEKM